MKPASRTHAPLVAELDHLDPLMALEAVSQLPYPFLLHSASRTGGADWSFFGAEPFQVHRGVPLDTLAAQWRASASATEPGARIAPFMGGAVGYWAYDLGRRFERMPDAARDDLGLPDYVLALYDVVGAIDHAAGRARLISSGLPLEGAERTRHAQARLDHMRGVIDRHLPRPSVSRGPGTAARSTFTRDCYLRAVETVREHIRAGDIFQANLSQRWSVVHAEPGPGEAAFAVFRGLVGHSAAPHAAYFNAGDHAIASASPERFLELRGRRVTTRPIKGTRPRGVTAAEDERLARELVASAKDRAENVMIVDVLRNDLGRVCETGSVRTEALCALESFPQVHHLVSTVSGQLRRGADFFDLLRATFPGGSITGAPKIRAMEILDGLEPVRRHIYTGAIGYLDWNGDTDWNIAIRTALFTERSVHFAAGGGIVADSDPHAEYVETLHKAEGMRLALETLLGPIELGEPTHAGRGR